MPRKSDSSSCISFQYQAPCNRTPFLSDAECYRGNVDIHQFDDIPFCSSYSPTLPGIPPEMVDTPVNLPIPPSCACVNIDYKINLGYAKRKKQAHLTSWSASVSFHADGDCCEGKYVADINMAIPCPLPRISMPPWRRYTRGNSWDAMLPIKLRFKYDKWSDYSSTSSVSFILAKINECQIQYGHDPIKLSIPCPIQDKRDDPKKIRARVRYADDQSQSSFSYVKENNESCTIEFYEPFLDLTIPCPVKFKGTGKITINGATAQLIQGDGSCGLTVDDVEFKIPIPEIDPDDFNVNAGMFAWDSERCCAGYGGVMVCRKWVGVENYMCGTGVYFVRVEFGSSSDIYARMVKGNYWNSNTSNLTYIPIYEIGEVDGTCKIIHDYRGAFVVQCWE